MIRRRIVCEEGRPGWLLISQCEHARLSAVLAQHCNAGWEAPEAADATFQQQLFAAIEHHDDGWHDWEQAPRLDPTTGQPLNFNELPVDQALPIWTASIEQGGARSPLAGWMIATHFLRLLGFSESMGADPRALAWREQYEMRRLGWRDAWRAAEPTSRSIALAEEAAERLWVFDAASLWLCLQCPLPGTLPEPPPEAWQLDPEGTLASQWEAVEPQVAGGGATPGRAQVVPWLFAGEQLQLTAAAQRVAAEDYGDGRELLAAAVDVELRWQLRPHGGSAVGNGGDAHRR